MKNLQIDHKWMIVLFRFMDPTGNKFMYMYYTDRKVLFAMCAGRIIVLSSKLLSTYYNRFYFIKSVKNTPSLLRITYLHMHLGC